MTGSNERRATPAIEGEAPAERYELHELLGRGGMACVYRATDLVTLRDVALKQLLEPHAAAERGRLTALFEREYQTLVQLRHPHVIEVYDYGLLANQTPYYTMELLDGGDLRERAPLPWQESCRLLFDVCSSLALLHSRRLLHRDVSPRNIRCTRAGRAKLIDFGAMAPMNAGGAEVVGTPAFVAPETVHRLALDARTDLFSLGATFYYALTGRLPYPARTFAEALAAWSVRIAAPSALVPEIPAALDDLVLSLLSTEPSLRPQSAFDVMHRLGAIAGLKSSEDEAVSRAYLVTPSLVGRDAQLDAFRKQLLAARISRGGATLIEGPSGVGRSRLLDACALEAQTLGFTVLRATASSTGGAFGTARDLTEHLRDALRGDELHAAAPLLWSTTPSADPMDRLTLKSFESPDLGPEPLQQALCELWLRVSGKHPLVIAIDDAHRIDPASASVLLALLDGSRRKALRLVLSADTSAEASDGLRALARRCEAMRLESLSHPQALQLLGSLFGEVANLEMLAHEIYQVTGGNPRQCMDTARHLVEHSVIRYAVGTWTIPSRLSADDLPRSGEAAMRARITGLSQHARFLAEAQSLALYPAWTDDDYRALLPSLDSPQLERAISELLQLQILVRDHAAYVLGNRLWTAALIAGLSDEQRALLHRTLAAFYRDKMQIAFIHHAFSGGLDEAGLRALQQLNTEYSEVRDTQKMLAQNVSKMVECYPRALETAQRLGLSAREQNELRRWHLAGATTVETMCYPESARLWLAQLERDSGLDLYRADSETTDPMQRLMRALQGAQERYLATPEPERVYPVEEAIKLLAEYVVLGIVAGTRTQDNVLLRSLPPLLEPFAALSPVLDAIWNNAKATFLSNGLGQFDEARRLWIDVLAKLDAASGTEMAFIREIGFAVAFAVGMMEAQLGLASATRWADRFEQDPYHRISALQLRRSVRLDQGDWNGAERLRRQAERLSLQSRGPQMFKTLLSIELASCTRACDLTGVQDVLERTRPLAELFPHWTANVRYAEGAFHLVRGDYAAAERKLSECIALSTFEPGGASQSSMMVWLGAVGGMCEALLASERAAEARETALHALDTWRPQNTVIEAADLVRVLSLAEAKLGIEGAVERLEAALKSQIELGMTGLRLGLSYEARALIAIWQGDSEVFERYAELTAQEYRYGAGSGLGMRYDRLINEAARHGLRVAVTPADFATDEGDSVASSAVNSMVSRSMDGVQRRDERARKALQILCEFRHVDSGHLFLMSSAGLECCASLGDAVATPDVVQLARFVADACARSRSMDEMETGELNSVALPETLLDVGGSSYELQLLACARGGEWIASGVAVLAHSDAVFDRMREGELLQALASHLLEPASDG